MIVVWAQNVVIISILLYLQWKPLPMDGALQILLQLSLLLVTVQSLLTVAQGTLPFVVKMVLGSGIVTGSILLSLRHNLPRELDDVHPLLTPVDDPYIQRSEWLWVIPLYMHQPLSDYPEWIQGIKATGKKLGLHGVYHTFDEFGTDVNANYLQRGIDEFERAFGYKPTHFKAPRLHTTAHNEQLIADAHMISRTRWQQIIHTVYHSPAGRQGGRLQGETK